MRSEGTLENSAFALWNKIAREFGVPKGKERLDTVRELRDLHINDCGDYLTYEETFRSLRSRLRRLGHDWPSFAYHDLFILGLGDWEEDFMQTCLDEFFSTHQGPIRDLDLDHLMQRLRYRASISDSIQGFQ